MDFQDNLFFIFLILSLLVFKALASTKYRNLFLLGVSFLFYASWEPWFLFVLITTILIDYVCGLNIYAQQKKGKSGKLYLVLSLCLNLGLLILFKYLMPVLIGEYTFFDRLGSFLNNNLVPIGISYYTFQTISYTVDIYNKKILPEKNFVDYSLFVSFFPQLLGGPIERASNFLPQIKLLKLKPNYEKAIWLLSYGYFLKYFISDNLSVYLKYFFANFENNGGPISVISYYFLTVIVLFSNFGGYSKIARGVGCLFGIDLIKNFGTPLFVRSYQEFWKEWHLSLTNWIIDYMYRPLKKKGFNSYLCFCCVFIITGLWHGVTIKFFWYIFIMCTTYCLNIYLYKKNLLYSSKYNWLNLFFGYCFVSLMGSWFMLPSSLYGAKLIQEVFNLNFDLDFALMGIKYFTLFCIPVFIIEFFSYSFKNEFYLLTRKWSYVLMGIMIFFTLHFSVDESDIFIYFLF
jgi:D-alanyl-lipoteichoic acid acyltransferase DltB (MBOAT superfamily)